jgi:hypothetical protein
VPWLLSWAVVARCRPMREGRWATTRKRLQYDVEDPNGHGLRSLSTLLSAAISIISGVGCSRIE